MARPTKITPARRRNLLAALRAGATLKAAAGAAGVSYETLRRWRAQDQELAAEMEEAEGSLMAELSATVVAAATGRKVAATGISVEGRRVGAGDPDLALRMLAAKWPEHFGRRTVEVSGPQGGPIVHEDYRERLRGRLEVLAERRAKRAAVEGVARGEAEGA